MDYSPAEDNSQKPEQAVQFLFCPDCSNILYPIADDANDTLNFSCRTCGATAPATSSCVYHHDLDVAAHDTAGVTQDVASDPTLPRTNRRCPACQENEAVYFQSQQRSRNTGMHLYYVCCSCGCVYK